MSDDRPILSYAPPARQKSVVADVLRFMGALGCLCGVVVGVLFVLAGASRIWIVFGPRSSRFWRSHEVFYGSLMLLIGLLMAGFAVRWFYFATRRRPRQTSSEDRSEHRSP